MDEAEPFDPLNQPYGATPIEVDVRGHLLATHQGLESLGELNTLEAANITRALLWLGLEGPSVTEVHDQYWLRELHRRMFGDVWSWAGLIRTREMTIGIAPYRIQEDWKVALDDSAWHVDNQTWSPAETVLRLHHRTVAIHPFVNGNGRHARMMADALADSLGLGADALSWGRHLDLEGEPLRRRYLSALRRMDADPDDVSGLIEFALDPRTVDEWVVS